MHQHSSRYVYECFEIPGRLRPQSLKCATHFCYVGGTVFRPTLSDSCMAPRDASIRLRTAAATLKMVFFHLSADFNLLCCGLRSACAQRRVFLRRVSQIFFLRRTWVVCSNCQASVGSSQPAPRGCLVLRELVLASQRAKSGSSLLIQSATSRIPQFAALPIGILQLSNSAGFSLNAK